MIKSLASIFFLSLCTLLILSFSNPKQSLESKDKSLAFHWIENNGQFQQDIAFLNKLNSSTVSLSREAVISYSLPTEAGRQVLSEKAVKANGTVKIAGQNRSELKINFINGTSKNQMINTASFQNIEMKNLWPGINVYLNSGQNTVEKILKVSPYSDPEIIRFEMEGMGDLCINETGALQVDMEDGNFYFSSPVAWQVINGKEIQVPVAFSIESANNSYSFEIGNYDPAHILFIDPLLSSSFLGGSNRDLGHQIKLGHNDLVYVAGMTESFDFPTTPGSYDQAYNDTTDIFVAVFDKDLNSLESCTFIGGGGADQLNDMVLDKDDNIYLSGRTQSHDFPVTAGAYDTDYNNPGSLVFGDMFVTALNSKADQLLYSTFIGSEEDEFAKTLDFDKSGNLILSGYTWGKFPAIGPQIEDETTGFIFFKMDPQLSTLLATNSIAANDMIWPWELCVDSSQNVYITGHTRATDFLTTPGAFSDTIFGKSDAFIIRIKNDLSEVLASTYFGGIDEEYSFSVITDSINNAYIAGDTKSFDFPFESNAYDTILHSADLIVSDAFIAILDSTLGKIHASSLLGGDGSETAYDLALDTSYSVLVCGYTSSDDFPVYCNSAFENYNGYHDAFVSRFSPRLEDLMASTFVGGSNIDHAYNLEVDSSNQVYVTGYTRSDDFPSFTLIDSTYNGGYGDAFVLKLNKDMDKELPCCTELLYPLPGSIDIELDIAIEWAVARGASGYFLNVGTTPEADDIIHHLDVGNTLNYDLPVLDCGDTIYVHIVPYNGNGVNKNCESFSFNTILPFYSSEDVLVCGNNNYSWFGMDLDSSGIYQMVFTDINGCDSSYQLNLAIEEEYYEFEQAQICSNDVYYWQGQYLDEAGTYFNNLLTETGCDSIFELELEVLPSYENSTTVSICQGDTLDWEGYELTLPGLYTQELHTVDLCDSVINLILVVEPSYYLTESYSICEGEALNWQGQDYSQSGVYQQTYHTMNGCDSIMELNLDVLPVYDQVIYESICAGDTLIWEDIAYTEAGVYTQYLSSINNCDSTVHLDLTIDAEYSFNESLYFCNGDTISWEGMTLDSAGDYAIHYQSLEGCDSSYYLELILAEDYLFSDTINICIGEMYEWQGMQLDSAGLYTADYQSIYGCDSSYVLELMHYDNYSFIDTVSICGGAVYDWQGMQLDSAGLYTASYNSVDGCDSTYVLQLDIVEPNSNITQSGDTLFAVDNAAYSYQWLRCPNMEVIVGEDDYTYIADSSGMYAVAIQVDGCVDTSACYELIHTGTESPIDQFTFTIYPNPVKADQVSLKIDGALPPYNIEIISINGKQLYAGVSNESNTTLDIRALESGLYIIRMRGKQGEKIKKLIVSR